MRGGQTFVNGNAQIETNIVTNSTTSNTASKNSRAAFYIPLAKSEEWSVPELGREPKVRCCTVWATAPKMLAFARYFLVDTEGSQQNG
jgi:hypothetical protein